jgi:hypothetical protein
LWLGSNPVSFTYLSCFHLFTNGLYLGDLHTYLHRWPFLPSMNLDTEVHSLLYKLWTVSQSFSSWNTYFGLLSCPGISVFRVWHSMFTTLQASRASCITIVVALFFFTGARIYFQVVRLIAFRSSKDD